MKRKAYPSDLTDAQRRLIAPLIPVAKPGGRPRKYEMREVIDGLLYLNREGCSSLALPHDFPHWKTCYNFFRDFEADGTRDASTQAVYDNLHALVAAGLVRRIEPAGHPGRYEARVGDNHHRVVCRRCGRMADVDCAIGRTPCLIPSEDHNFAIDEAEVTFWGTCPDCRAAAQPTTPPGEQG